MDNLLTDGNKTRIRNNIIEGAKNYDEFLIKKVFKIICLDGTQTRVRFFKNDFQHLTGIETDLSETDFYDMCLDERISNGNILSNQKYDWSTLKGKTNRIANLQELLYSETNKMLLLNNLITNTKIFPTAIRNDDIGTCVGFVSDINKARSLRKSGASQNSEEEKAIALIVAKKDDGTIFDELVYVKNKELIPTINELSSEDLSDEIKLSLSIE